MAGAENGGAEAFFERLVPALHDAGLEQEVMIRHNSARADRLRARGIEPVEVPFGGKMDIRSHFSLNSTLRRFKPQVVLTWMNRATRFCPPTKGRFVHVGRLGGYYKMENYQSCDHLIGNTKDLVQYMVKSGWPEDRAHYLPNFVSVSEADPLPRAIHATPKEAPLILALGRFHENKGYDVLFRAMAKLPHVYLWLAGVGPLRGELMALAIREGVRPRIRFLGWHEDPTPLFRSADMLICPSRHEPLGNVVIEGWAHDVPVIATQSKGPGALIRHNRSGLLVPVDEPDALAKTIKRLLMSPELMRNIIQGGRESYEKNFSESVAVGRYMRFLKKVAL
jgi:glycosyltransferase involved in cell wall biosynthesis